MLSLLFNEDAWSNSVAYEEHDFVYLMSGSTPLYFYARADNSGQNPTGAGSGYWTNQFLWKPSYATNNSISTRKITAQFGDGYSQRQRDGINNVLSNLSLVFENRSDKESKAIMHFVEQKGGVEAFPMNIHMYKTGIRYIAEELKHDYISYNNNTVSFTAKHIPDLS